MRKVKLMFLVSTLIIFCSGCWDMKEINQLAIVNIAAADKDPESGLITAYYQVINPSGVSSRSGASGGAAVYTYEFTEYSSARFESKTSQVMPRQFYTPQIQCYIVSERYAKQGLVDLINFLEHDPERRTNVDIVVSDAPLSIVMNSFTSLERVPGRYIRALFELHSRNFHNGEFPGRLNELAKGINFHQPTIIPILDYSGKRPADKMDKLGNIDASKDSISFSDGAVFINARMVGKVGVKYKTLFYILNGNIMKFVEPIEIDGASIDVEAQHVRVKRSYQRQANRLVINIQADLRILSNNEDSNLTVVRLKQIEKAFNESLQSQSLRFDEWSKKMGWDMLGIQDESRGSVSWRNTKVDITVNSKVTTTGNTGAPYKVKEAK